jgi:hypothetical protein
MDRRSAVRFAPSEVSTQPARHFFPIPPLPRAAALVGLLAAQYAASDLSPDLLVGFLGFGKYQSFEDGGVLPRARLVPVPLWCAVASWWVFLWGFPFPEPPFSNPSAGVLSKWAIEIISSGSDVFLLFVYLFAITFFGFYRQAFRWLFAGLMFLYACKRWFLFALLMDRCLLGGIFTGQIL